MCKIILLSARMTLFSPEVVIESSMEIDEAIDRVLRACRHRLIAATHNGMAHPTMEASDLGNKLCFILYSPAQYHPSSDLSTHDSMPGDDFQLLKWPLKESPETPVPLLPPLSRKGCCRLLAVVESWAWTPAREGDL